MAEIQEITELIKAFRDERDWAQFHTGKNLAINLSVEASELLELFQWKEELDANGVTKLKAELADVLYSALLLADSYSLNVREIVEQKLDSNRKKYPVEKAKGSSKKYTEF